MRERYPQHVFSSCPLSEVIAVEGVAELFKYEGEDSTDGEAALARLLANLSSPTSKGDITGILLRKLVVSFAKRHNCEAILWGDSTTRLAKRTLAETAKGRGASLPWIVADGELLHGVPFYYPMRDLLGKEITAFTTFVEPPLADVIAKEVVKPIVSTKNTTIDDLMKQYFESVERVSQEGAMGKPFLLSHS